MYREEKLQHNFDEKTKRWDSDCKKYNVEQDRDVLPMWIADSDFYCAKPIVDALRERIEEGIYGYPIMRRDLCEAYAVWEAKRFTWKVNVDWIRFVPGVVPGIIFAIRALTKEGDGIVVQTPCYPPFLKAIQDNKREIVRNRIIEKNGSYCIDFEDLEQKLAKENVKVFILCNPHNPSGRVFTKEELQRIGNLCLKYNVCVLSDEIHCDIVYKGFQHIPFGSISDTFAENSVVFLNASKTFNIAGFRTAGMICKNDTLRKKIEDCIWQNKANGENICGSLATIIAYTKCEYYADELIPYLERNLEIVVEEISKIEQIHFIRPQGTYLLWLDCRKMGLSQTELEEFFLQKAKLRLSNGTDFGFEGEGFMRMNIATQKENVKEAMRRIQEALKS